jgi:hypothetical protein
MRDRKRHRQVRHGQSGFRGKHDQLLHCLQAALVAE